LAANSLISAISTSQTAVSFANFFNIAGGTIFSFLPVFVGYTATKKWGGNP